MYIGITSDLVSRIIEHQQKKFPQSFSARYNLYKLIYYESFFSIEEAIDREKQIKKWRREKKEQLINKMNPDWNDLFDKEVRFW